MGITGGVGDAYGMLGQGADTFVVSLQHEQEYMILEPREHAQRTREM